jgi:hypothetical protein
VHKAGRGTDRGAVEHVDVKAMKCKNHTNAVTSDRHPVELLRPACRRNGVNFHTALIEAEMGNLQVIRMGCGWHYTPVGAVERLIEDRLNDRRY